MTTETERSQTAKTMRPDLTRTKRGPDFKPWDGTVHYLTEDTHPHPSGYTGPIPKPITPMPLVDESEA